MPSPFDNLASKVIPLFLRPSFWRLMGFPVFWEQRRAGAWVTLAILLAIPLVGVVDLGLGLFFGGFLEPAVNVLVSGFACMAVGLILWMAMTSEIDLKTVGVMGVVFGSAFTPYPFLVAHALFPSLWQVAGALAGGMGVLFLWHRVCTHVWAVRRMAMKREEVWAEWEQSELRRHLSKSLPVAPSASPKKRL